MSNQEFATNALIGALSPALRRSLANDLHPRYLRSHEIIELGSDVVFPLTGIVSITKQTTDGLSAGGAVVGRDGVVALKQLPQVVAIVQGAGESVSMSRTAYNGYLGDCEFRDVMDDYKDKVVNFCLQAVACQAFHLTEARLAFWLLESYQRTGRLEMALTQDFIATMLAVQRPTVTIAARGLQDRKLISYRYGRINLTDVEGLVDASCECRNFV